MSVTALVVAGARPASAAPGFTIGPTALPETAEQSRVVLREELLQAPPGSRTRSDIAYVLRLAGRLLAPGHPVARKRTVVLTLKINAWWYSRRAAPASRVVVRAPNGVLATYFEGHGFSVNPVATTGRWLGLNRSVSPEKLADAMVPLGVPRTAGTTRFSVWEYYDVPDRPAAIRPGASGMAQARMVQLFARAYHRTSDPRYVDAAARALAAFTVTVRHGGVVSRVSEPAGTPPQPWYVERAYPGANPWKGAALNGLMVALLNLHTAEEFLRSRPRAADGSLGQNLPGATEAATLALERFAAGLVTLVQYLPLHDTGHWSVYGLLTPGYGWREYLANDTYHCYHVRLLRQLDAIAPDAGLGAVADRWDGYAVARGVDCGSPATTQEIAAMLHTPAPVRLAEVSDGSPNG